MKTVIFLDIDGVLRPFHPYRSIRTQKESMHTLLYKKYGDHRYDALDEGILSAVCYDWHKEAVHALHIVLQKTDAKLVLSSSWRLFYTMEELKLLFHLHDLDSYLYDQTKNLGKRSDEIKEYVIHHPDIIHYLILDDIPLEHDFPFHALTTHEYFKADQIPKALMILNDPSTLQKCKKTVI